MIDYQAELNPAQYEAVMVESGPVLIIAGAGSGKTRTLVYRVARLVEMGVDPSAVLLLTFTRRAATEMLDRAARIGPESCRFVAGGTFHSVAYGILRRYAGHLGYERAFTVIDRADSENILGELRNELVAAKSRRGRGKKLPLKRTIADVLSKSINIGADIEQTIIDHYPHLIDHVGAMMKLWDAYVDYKRQAALMDYDDLLVLLVRLLEHYPEQRKRIASGYHHLLVDEYQDTNHLQAGIVRLLAQDHDNVMIVGDDSQSIYSFRGARIRNIMDFPTEFDNVRVIKLEQNYRSTQPILDLTNAVISEAAETYTKCLFTDNKQGPKPRLTAASDETNQSRLVLEAIDQFRRQGVPLDQIAVLMRAAFHSFDLEVNLTGAGIPFIKVGGYKFLELAHVKDLLAHLRVVVNNRDFYSWQRILLLIEGVGPKRGQDIIRHLARHGPQTSYIEALEGAPGIDKRPGLRDLHSALERIAGKIGAPLTCVEEAYVYYEPILRARYPDDYPKRMRDLEHLVGLVHDHDDLQRFLAEVALDPPVSERRPKRSDNVLTLSTIHSAKGLEWEAVLIIWTAEGRFPSIYAGHDPDEMEEERRLMYVACTRAKRFLGIFYPKRFYVRGEGELLGEPSRFVAQVDPDLFEGGRAQVKPPLAGNFQSAFDTGARVRHPQYGQGTVMGARGDFKVLVDFKRFGLRTVHVNFDGLKLV